MFNTTNTPLTFEVYTQGKNLTDKLKEMAYQQYLEGFNLELKYRQKTCERNCVAKIAYDNDRNYVTPEDICEALKLHPADKVRLDALEHLGNISGFGVEDKNLFAFIAFEGNG